MRQRFTQTLPLIGTLCLLIIGSAVLFKLTPADAIISAEAIAEPPVTTTEVIEEETFDEIVPLEFTEYELADLVKAPEPEQVDSIYFEANDAIILDKYYTNDVYVAGNTILVTGTIVGDLFAAGSSITVDGDVMGSVRAAGSQININRQVGRNVLVFAESVDIAGTVFGDVTGSVENVQITGTTYGEVEIEDSADREEIEPAPKPFVTPFKVLRLFISLLGWLALGLVVINLFPKCSKTIVEQMRKKPSRSFGFGALVVLVGPIALLVLTITLIGMPLAIVAALVWIGLLLIAKLYFGIAIGQLLLPKSSTMIWPFVLGFSLVYVITQVISWFGWIGWWLGCVIMLVGIIWAAGSIIQQCRTK